MATLSSLEHVARRFWSTHVTPLILLVHREPVSRVLANSTTPALAPSADTRLTSAPFLPRVMIPWLATVTVRALTTSCLPPNAVTLANATLVGEESFVMSWMTATVVLAKILATAVLVQPLVQILPQVLSPATFVHAWSAPPASKLGEVNTVI